jgi:hypothetical protein
MLHNSVANTLRIIKKNEINITLDFNAKVGREAAEEVIGKYGLGDRNDSGDIQFCLEEEYVIKNITISRHADYIRGNRYEIVVNT